MLAVYHFLFNTNLNVASYRARSRQRLQVRLYVSAVSPAVKFHNLVVVLRYIAWNVRFQCRLRLATESAVGFGKHDYLLASDFRFYQFLRIGSICHVANVWKSPTGSRYSRSIAYR